VNILINGAPREVAPAWRDDTLLAVLREHLGLCGSKYGCGMGLCGACTVLLDGQPQRACLVPVADVRGRAVTTIEGLASGDKLHPVQQAWLDDQVAQCGYCQAGQIMAAAALLQATRQPSDAQIDAALAGHLCRCGTQSRVRAAIHRAAAQMAGARP
jgi:isoquinoline 1-oxidoreductase alpha subunit